MNESLLLTLRSSAQHHASQILYSHQRHVRLCLQIEFAVELTVYLFIIVIIISVIIITFMCIPDCSILCLLQQICRRHCVLITHSFHLYYPLE